MTSSEPAKVKHRDWTLLIPYGTQDSNGCFEKRRTVEDEQLTQRKTRGTREPLSIPLSDRRATTSALFGSVNQRRQGRGEKRRIHRLRQIGLKSGIKCVRLAVSADVCAQRGRR